MLVGVTGGSGFLGGHSVAALVRDGHRVRMLVRDEARAARTLDGLGVPEGAADLVHGDALDEGAVERTLKGVDAVLHAAAVYSFDSRRRREMRAVNERAAEVVLSAARRATDGPVIHVSTVVALDPSRPLDETSPLLKGGEAYAATKSAADAVARRHQDDGAPVLITYPPALLGPADPGPGDQNGRLRDVLRGLTPLWPGGGYPVGDVRDTAELHAALLAEPSPPPRSFGPGRYLTTRDYLRTLRRVTGRRLPALVLPPALMAPAGLLADTVQRIWPWHIPAEYGAIRTCATAAPVAAAAETLGLVPRPAAETIRDTVRWLHHRGLVTAAQAGRAAFGEKGTS